MSITRFRTPTDIVSLREAVDRMLEQSFIWPRGWLASRTGADIIPLDMYEEGNNLIVKAPVPGVKPEDLNIEIREDVLTISGEIKEEKEHKQEDYHLREQRYGRLERSVALPCAVIADDAEAEFDAGVLTLTLPKAAATEGKKIAVKSKVKAGK